MTSSLLLLPLLLLQASAEPDAPERSHEAWAAEFWAGPTVEERNRVARAWIATEPPFVEVLAALEDGRRYATDAPKGYLLRKRTGSGGLVHPYLIIVPEHYTPDRTWPVRLELHGGMGAGPWDPEAAEWAGGWNRAGDQFMVIPAGWWGSKWWQASQVENIEAILRELRATWNVDEDRVVAVGTSDGGAGLFFLAMRTPDRFASYAGFVAPPDRLVRAEMEPDGQMHVPNLGGQRFHFGFGEHDRKVPLKYIERYMELFDSFGADLDWYVLEDQGHSLTLPEEKLNSFIDFMGGSRRDALPDRLSWSTEDPERYGRRAWLRIDALTVDAAERPVDEARLLPRWGTRLQLRGPTAPRVPYGTLEATRDGNHISIHAEQVGSFTLLLSPRELDLDQPVRLEVNGALVREELIAPSVATLLHWAARDDDRRRLFAAEWRVEVSPGEND